MLIKTLKWRAEFKMDEILKEEFPNDVFGNLGHIYGKDKGGRPVTFVHNAGFSCHILLKTSLCLNDTDTTCTEATRV